MHVKVSPFPFYYCCAGVIIIIYNRFGRGKHLFIPYNLSRISYFLSANFSSEFLHSYAALILLDSPPADT